MADYSHMQSYSPRPAAQTGDQHHYGIAATVLAAVVLAAIAWVWSQQQAVESPLPQPVAHSAAAVSLTPANRAAPAMTRAAPEIAPPASQAVAAAGDTRAVAP